MNSEDRIFNGNFEDNNWHDKDGNLIEKENLNEYFKNESKKRLEEAMNKYMPIGSVIKLKNKIGLYMVIGYKYKNNNVEYDYFSAKYPGGLTNNAQIYVFNHDEIKEIHHIGMSDERQIEYKRSLLGENEGFKKTL